MLAKSALSHMLLRGVGWGGGSILQHQVAACESTRTHISMRSHPPLPLPCIIQLLPFRLTAGRRRSRCAASCTHATARQPQPAAAASGRPHLPMHQPIEAAAACSRHASGACTISGQDGRRGTLGRALPHLLQLTHGLRAATPQIGFIQTLAATAVHMAAASAAAVFSGAAVCACAHTPRGSAAPLRRGRRRHRIAQHAALLPRRGDRGRLAQRQRLQQRRPVIFFI